MKRLILKLILLTTFSISAQEFPKKIFFDDFVECYYSKKVNESILIYDSPNGEKIDELNQLTEKYCWYKFAISESKNGWLKIENILALPGCGDSEVINDFEQHKGKWVIAKNMVIDLPDVSIESGIKMKFYENPNKNSSIIFTTVEYLSTELIEINGIWAKVKFTKNGKAYTGWLEDKYQCAYPWTTCPVYD